MSLTQYNTGTCADCGAPTTVTPDPYSVGSAHEFSVVCSINEHHTYVKSYDNAKPAPAYVIASPKPQRQPRSRRQSPPITPRSPAHSSLLASLLKG